MTSSGSLWLPLWLDLHPVPVLKLLQMAVLQGPSETTDGSWKKEYDVGLLIIKAGQLICLYYPSYGTRVMHLVLTLYSRAAAANELNVRPWTSARGTCGVIGPPMLSLPLESGS